MPGAYHDSHVPFGEVDLDPTAAGVTFENKTLNEDFDSYGRLIQRVGTDEAKYSDSYGRNYMDDATEVYQAGQTVVWDIYNTTADTHPMHFHLVNVQVLGRADFDNYNPSAVTFTPTSGFTPPDPNYAWVEGNRSHEPGRSHARDHEIRSAHRQLYGTVQHAARNPDGRSRICVALPHPGA